MDPVVLSPEMKAVREEVMAAVNGLKSAYDQQFTQIAAKGHADPETVSKVAAFAARCDALEALMQKPRGEGANVISKTIGMLFCESPAFLNSKLKTEGAGGSARFDIKSWFYDRPTEPFLMAGEQKTTITSSAVGTAVDQPFRLPGIITPQLRQLRIRDLLPKGTLTSGNSIEYVKENAFTSNASPQVEASDKAESALTFTLATANVRTIAHWIPASRQILDDMAMLMSYIDQRLRYGLALEEEKQLLTGDGTGQHLSGLITQATAFETARNLTGDTKIDTIRHAIAQARLAEFPVDGLVINPNDWEKIELVKTQTGGSGTNTGEYVYGDPGSVKPFNLWGRAVVETTAIASGTFLVGAFALGAMLWDRMNATVDVSTEHSDFFIKNLVAIRAEERIALSVFRPGAFVYGAYPS